MNAIEQKLKKDSVDFALPAPSDVMESINHRIDNYNKTTKPNQGKNLEWLKFITSTAFICTLAFAVMTLTPFQQSPNDSKKQMHTMESFWMELESHSTADLNTEFHSISEDLKIVSGLFSF